MTNSARRRLVPLLLVALAAALPACSDEPLSPPPGLSIDLARPWVLVEPEAVRVDPGAIFVAGELAGRIDRLRSLLVVRDGRLAYERYYGGFAADSLADVRSVTKSVVSTLVGVALQQGQIRSLDQSITDFLAPPRYPVRLEHAAITVRHLLTMTGGFAWTESGAAGYNEWIAAGDHVTSLLSREIVESPGSTFAYNSAAAHLLGIVLQEATQTSLPTYAARVLFGPLGIRDAAWEPFAEGTVNGSSGLDLRPRDLARFGQLALQRGWSGARSVVPSPWFEEATDRSVPDIGRVDPIGRASYGFLWWIDLERGAYLAWGFAGQFVYVVPDASLVVVATTDWRGVNDDIGSQRLQDEVLGIIVDRVLPALR